MNSIRDMEIQLANAQVDEELANPLLATRTHGTLSCYMAGCRGPMCRAVNTATRREQRGIFIKPDHVDTAIAERIRVHQEARAERLTHQRRGSS